MLKDDDGEPQIKKSKRNLCPNCLGILDDSEIEQMLSNVSLEQIDYYNRSEFVTQVILPKCIPLRSYSIYLYLKKLFPNLKENPWCKYIW